MPFRPCAAHAWDLAGEKQPTRMATAGVGAIVRNLGDSVGLRQMGVHLRSIEPGMAGTNRHFHTAEEEWAYVLSGRGLVRIGPHRIPVHADSFVGFPPGPRPHHFIAEGEEPMVLLEGGERIADDIGCYVDIPKWFQAGKVLEVSGPPPLEEGDASQVLHLEDAAERVFQHEVDPAARRVMRRLNRPSGLVRQAVVWSRVEAGTHSTAFHTHDRTDEWILIFAGRARVRVGDERFEVGPNDFIGHPAGGAAHVMEPTEPLTYLMGGQIDPEDIVIYPDAGVRRVRGVLEPI